MMRILVTFMFFFLAASMAIGSSDQTWNKAAEAYRAGNYQESLELFRNLEDEARTDDLFYNIGNCYYRLDSIPRAILYFEKAVKLNPRNKEARENLELARSKMDEPVIGIEQFFLLRWAMNAAHSVSPLGWGIIVVALLWMAAIGYTRAIRAKRNLRIRELIVAGVLILMGLFLGYVSYHETMRVDYGVVMENVNLNEAPDELSPVSRALEGGEKVHILDNIDGYYKVRLINFEVGWVPESVVSRI